MGSAFHQLCPRYSGTLTPTAPTAIRLWDTFTFTFFVVSDLDTDERQCFGRDIDTVLFWLNLTILLVGIIITLFFMQVFLLLSNILVNVVNDFSATEQQPKPCLESPNGNENYLLFNGNTVNLHLFSKFSRQNVNADYNNQERNTHPRIKHLPTGTNSNESMTYCKQLCIENEHINIEIKTNKSAAGIA